jgi:hypothetical protein
VRRIGADRAAGVERHARISAAFGAVAVHDVHSTLRDSAHHMRHRDDIAWPDVAAHGDADDAKGERWCKFPKNLIGAGPTSVAVGDQADVMPTRDLFVGKVENMAEQAADRRAEHEQDPQGGQRVIPNRAVAAAVDDEKLNARIERIPPRVWTCPAGLGVGAVNKR